MSRSSSFQILQCLKKSLLGAVLSLAAASSTFALEHSLNVEQAITDATYQYHSAQLEALAEKNTGYDKAYALYRLAQVNMTHTDKRAVIGYLNHAIELLTPLKDSEATVLHAAVIGLLMGVDPVSASTLYPQMQQMLAEAKQHKSARARALLIEGTNAFFVPPAYGGGTEKARRLLEESLNLFQKAPNDTPVTWGEVDAYIWLGRVHEQEGEKDKARGAYEQALTLHPNCTWANYQLEQLNVKP